MYKFVTAAALALGLSVGMADTASALDITLDTCKVAGDCDDATGSIDTSLNLVGGDLEVFIENNITSNAGAFINDIGFVYDGTITGLTVVAFTPSLGSVVGTPSLITNGKITSIDIDFGFDFPQANDANRFNVGESVTILLDFTGNVVLENFLSGVAHINAGTSAGESVSFVDSPDDADDDDNLDIVDDDDDDNLDVTPEPASLLLLGSGMAIVGARFRRRNR